MAEPRNPKGSRNPERDRYIVRMHEAGHTQVAISRVVELSYQRVQQIVAKVRADPEWLDRAPVRPPPPEAPPVQRIWL